MDSPNYMILIYSKYSPKCKQILELLSQQSVDFLKPLCVDNARARSAILSDSRYGITTVPAILLVYPNNTVEKFEGPNVAEWVINQLSPQLEPQQQEEEIDDVMPQPKKSYKRTNLQELVEDEHEEDDVEVIERQIDVDITRSIVSNKPVDIMAMAQKMAKSREDADIPIHQRKREIAQEEMANIP